MIRVQLSSTLPSAARLSQETPVDLDIGSSKASSKSSFPQTAARGTSRATLADSLVDRNRRSPRVTAKRLCCWVDGDLAIPETGHAATTGSRLELRPQHELQLPGNPVPVFGDAALSLLLLKFTVPLIRPKPEPACVMYPGPFGFGTWSSLTGGWPVCHRPTPLRPSLQKPCPRPRIDSSKPCRVRSGIRKRRSPRNCDEHRIRSVLCRM